MSTRERPQLFFADLFGNFDRWSIEEISNDIRHESTVLVKDILHPSVHNRSKNHSSV